MNEVKRDYAFRVYAVDDTDALRLRDLWDAVWRGRWLIGATAVAATVLALAASYLFTPAYRSWVVVAPVSQTSGSSGLAMLASQFAGVPGLSALTAAGGSTERAEAVATLKSRVFTEAFIREHDLVPILFAELYDANSRTWHTESGKPPTPWQAYLRFDEIRSVDEDLQTGLFEVVIRWTDPVQSAEWANGLVDDVNRVLRTRAIAESRKNLDFLRAALEKSSQLPVQSTIYGMIEAELKDAMFANVRQDYAFRVIDPATVPEFKYWPNRLLFGLLGLFVGLAAGLVAAILRASRERGA